MTSMKISARSAKAAKKYQGKEPAKCCLYTEREVQKVYLSSYPCNDPVANTCCYLTQTGKSEIGHRTQNRHMNPAESNEYGKSEETEARRGSDLLQPLP
ncbi:hypothetical protein Y1Q_0024644 [Alligator mississippiensis]|uniref:Uncharacterized protein n=1 Tax=Alligator mississippiensis TaxID=8496 RepID=A0A151NBQ2_ALLMI|nr:hypothetical protein Y1Q_0024644 [Alligator mississippiensis]